MKRLWPLAARHTRPRLLAAPFRIPWRAGPSAPAAWRFSAAATFSRTPLWPAASGPWAAWPARPYSTNTKGEGLPREPDTPPPSSPERPGEPKEADLQKKAARGAARTKEELLRRARTAVGRLAVRFRWLMIRQQKKFNTDDLSAMFSWIIWGHILWIVLGTTTFLSLLIWLLSKVRLEDSLAKWVSNLVTQETGLRVTFEEAMVPDLKQGVIILRKVFVSRRPGTPQEKAKVGSQSDAAAAAAAASARAEPDPADSADDGNYTQFDVTIDNVAVTLSVTRWLTGRGLLRTVEIKGLRGVVDRRHVRWDPTEDPTAHRYKPRRGDFDFELFTMEDVMVDVLQPGLDQPCKLSIYTCDLPQLRKRWVLYDFLNANNISGSYDNSLFTLHPRQSARLESEDAKEVNSSFRRMQRLRVDDLNIRHLNRNDTGMFGWIESGSVNFLADIMLPSNEPELPFREKVKDVIERWEAILTGRARGDEIVTAVEKQVREREAHKLVLIDLRVQFNNTRTSAPLYSPDLNYLNNALLHPLVGYLNSRDTVIPLHCRIIKPLLDFDGSWTMFDSNLMAEVSAELYSACLKDVADEEARRRRIRKVGFWSLQFLAQLVLLTLGIVA